MDNNAFGIVVSRVNWVLIEKVTLGSFSNLAGMIKLLTPDCGFSTEVETTLWGNPKLELINHSCPLESLGSRLVCTCVGIIIVQYET